MPESNRSLESSLREIRLLAGALLISALLYIPLGKSVGPSAPRDVRIYLLILVTLAVSDLWMASALRLRSLRPGAEALHSNPADQGVLKSWRINQIVSLVMCETIALLGFGLRILGGTPVQTIPFYLLSALMMLVWWPRRP